MARIRTIKPGFFRHRKLFLAEQESGLPLRLAFSGLWTVADREGRFKWEPEELKLDCLPYDDVDFAAVLQALAEHDFIACYEHGEELYGHIPKWAKHQHVNQREAVSEIPAPDNDGASTCNPVTTRGEGKGKEQEGVSLPTEARPPDDANKAIEAFNEIATEAGWPLVQRKTSQRISAVNARLRECGGFDGWREALKRARASPFLCGDNDRGWKADFDFLTKSKNFTKLMEGGYDRTRNTQSPGGNRTLAALASVVNERADARGRRMEPAPVVGADDGAESRYNQPPECPEIPAGLRRY